MLLKEFLVKTSALMVVFLTAAQQLAQEGCCSVNPTPLYSASSGEFGIVGSVFPSNGCFAFATFDTLTTTTYNPVTCNSGSFSSTTTSLSDLGFANGLATITGNTCSSLVVVDEAGQILTYDFSGCSPTNPPFQNIPSPIIGTFPTAITTTGTCAIIVYSNIHLSACAIDATDCSLSNTFSFVDLSSCFSFRPHQIVSSSPASSCPFVIATSSSSPPTNFVIVPLVGCTFGTPVAYPQTNGTPFTAASSPDGKYVAVGFLNNNFIQIYTVNDCTLTLTGPQVPISGSAISLNYSPDGLCLACLNSNETQIFPVNPATGLLNATDVTTLPVSGSSGNSVFFSPQSVGCNLLAIAGTNIETGMGAFFYSRNGCHTSLAIFDCCASKVSSHGTITYTISIKNTGTAAATGLQLQDILPSCLTYISGNGTDWSFEAVGNIVTASLSDVNALQPGDITTLTITAQAHCCSGQKITNVVTASATNVPASQTSSCITKVT